MSAPQAALLERSAALAAIGDALAALDEGQGGAVFVVGDAGTGKTAIIRAVRQLVDPRILVSARASTMESGFPYALVDQLIGAVPAGGTTDPWERRAQVHDAARGWLRERGRAVILLDDLHWADPDSLAVLGFLARRVSALPVLLVGALRGWPRPAAGMVEQLVHDGEATTIGIDALSERSTAQLLVDRLGAEQSPAIRRRAYELTGGNPLLVTEVARILAQDGRLDRPHEFPGGLLLSHLSGLPVAAVDCARAASVLGTRARLAAVEALVDAAPSAFASSVDVLVEAGVLAAEPGGWVAFRHDLLAAAVYEGIAPGRRRLLHRRAFDHHAARGELAAAAEHALAAGLAGDPSAIGVLVDAAEVALASGAPEVGVRQLAGAVDLAGDRPPADLLVKYADVLLAVGRPQEAISVYQRMLADSTDRAPLPILAKIAQGLAYSGRLDAAMQAYEQVIAAADDGARLPLLMERAHAIWELRGPVAALAASDEYAQLASPLSELVTAIRALLRLQAGDPGGIADLDVMPDFGTAATVAHPVGRTVSFNSFLMKVSAYTVVERFEETLDQVDKGAMVLRETGAARAVVPLRLMRLSVNIRLGELAAAIAEIDDVEETGPVEPILQPYFLLMRAQALLLMGRAQESWALCDAVERVPGILGWTATMQLGDLRGQVLLARGEAERSLETFAEVAEVGLRMGVREPCSPGWVAGALEAALACGRTDTAGQLLDWLDDVSAPLPCQWPRMVLLAGRAALAEPAEADRLFQQALALPVPLPVDRARVMLRSGGWLRGRRELRRARTVLHEAVRIAETAGATLIAEPAQAELAGAGGRRRGSRPGGSLTAQESRVAGLAVTGATVQEIATAMYLSPRTVETHLARVYRKLGVASKAELRRRKSELSIQPADLDGTSQR